MPEDLEQETEDQVQDSAVSDTPETADPVQEDENAAPDEPADADTSQGEQDDDTAEEVATQSQRATPEVVKASRYKALQAEFTRKSQALAELKARFDAYERQQAQSQQQAQTPRWHPTHPGHQEFQAKLQFANAFRDEFRAAEGNPELQAQIQGKYARVLSNEDVQEIQKFWANRTQLQDQFSRDPDGFLTERIAPQIEQRIQWELTRREAETRYSSLVAENQELVEANRPILTALVKGGMDLEEALNFVKKSAGASQSAEAARAAQVQAERRAAHGDAIKAAGRKAATQSRDPAVSTKQDQMSVALQICEERGWPKTGPQLGRALVEAADRLNS